VAGGGGASSCKYMHLPDVLLRRHLLYETTYKLWQQEGSCEIMAELLS
jgi:hypothetical protein